MMFVLETTSSKTSQSHPPSFKADPSPGKPNLAPDVVADAFVDLLDCGDVGTGDIPLSLGFRSALACLVCFGKR